MKFCSNCDNMLYISIDSEDANKLTHTCRQCGYIDPIVGGEGLVVLDTKLKMSEQKSRFIINDFTKFDPTLPRIYTLKCPNNECKTNDSDATQTEIIYLRSNDADMKYIYLCPTCDTQWMTGDKK